MDVLPGRTRPVTIVAQDPGVRDGDDNVIMAEVDIPSERLEPGPRGHRVHVIDYDATLDRLYQPYDFDKEYKQVGHDPFRDITFDRIIGDPSFHSWNTYAIAMRTLGRFEFALGRKVAWNQAGHQLKVFPHAFRDANAFYARDSESLMFGYFRGRKNTIFSCLAHDVIAHETSHAVIDGLRSWFTDPSSKDQGAFHEGFSDVVALLEVFSVPVVVRALLERSWGEKAKADPTGEALDAKSPDKQHLEKEGATFEKLVTTHLFGLAEEMGKELASTRGNALRRSVVLKPFTEWLDDATWDEPHRRGEIISAAMLRAFARVWSERIERLQQVNGEYDIWAVAVEGAEAAATMVTTAIRAIDYTPPIHLTFKDYLSALLTADYELRPHIDRYGLREHLKRSFAEFGIQPAPDAMRDEGRWAPERAVRGGTEERFDYSRSRFESMQRDPDEVFRFAFENRSELGLIDDAYTQVSSIRPALRIAPEDGVVLRETVVEVIQQIELECHELAAFGVAGPTGMGRNESVVLRGGATLIFDDYGRLKYRVKNALPRTGRRSAADQHVSDLHTERICHLWDTGQIGDDAQRLRADPVQDLHLRKSLMEVRDTRELW